jgi:DNA-binding NarL/FixJ family response regulator
MRPRIVLADDHAMVAEGLGRIIMEIGDVVGTVRDGVELVEAVRRLQPDIVVADVTMPGMSGIDALRQLRVDGSRARFIFLTIHTEARLAAEALRAGASGYLLKHAAGEELLVAIRTVLEGRTYLTPMVTKEVLQNLSGPDAIHEPKLTPRQREVLRRIAQGERLKEIAFALGISVRTVEDHKYQLMRTLGVESTADLVRFAIKQRIVPD